MSSTRSGRKASSFSREALDVTTAESLTPNAARRLPFQRGLSRRISSEANGSSQLQYRPAAAYNRSADGSDDSEQYADVQEELDQIGHNLTSVLNNPRETVFDMLYEALDPEQSYPIESYADGASQDRNKQQPKQQDIDMSDVAAFLNQTGQLARAFEKNHPTPAQKAQQQQ
eukprot:7161-Heterococcus_DN1.PRE.1